MTDITRELGVAVVGLGVGIQHAYAYQSHPNCRILMLCDVNLTKAQQYADEFDTEATDDFEVVLRNPDVQIVSIASFDADHAGQVTKALDAGKHVFVEKPLCQTMEELKSIQQAWIVHQGRIKLGSNLILRAAPLYNWVREKIQSGEFGSIYSFEGEYLYGRLEKITHGWRSTADNYSVMAGGGIHLIDLLLWIILERPTTTIAMGNRIASEGSAFRFYDYVTATMQNDSGVVARITSNFGCVHRHHHVLRIFGTKASFIYDDAGARLHTSRDALHSASPVDLSPLPLSKGDLIPPFISGILADEDRKAETQSIFDGMSISIASDHSLITQKPQLIQYI